MAEDWIEDPSTTAEEKLAHFEGLSPVLTRGPEVQCHSCQKTTTEAITIRVGTLITFYSCVACVDRMYRFVGAKP